jgi:hypothetical protein
MTNQDEAAEESGERPCEETARRQFDFWLGDWRVSWGDAEKGTNQIQAVLGGCVILERFDGRPGTPLRGMSVSSYDPGEDCWRQTWVDNQGGYLDFEGAWQGDRMILTREADTGDGPVLQRMVWYAIRSDSLEWNWERSTDGGENWKVLWQIHYHREAVGA